MELAGIAKSLSMGKAPGPDGVPNMALKVAIAETPEMFRSAMQKCQDEGVFPEAGKRQSLVLLPKAGKPLGDPLAYRPICLTDTAGSTVDAILSVTKTAEKALEPKRRGIRSC